MTTVHAIAINETQEWNLDAFSEEARNYVSQVYSVYACDMAKTFCCSLSPSAWCEYLYSFVEYNTAFDLLSDEEQEIVRNNISNILHAGNPNDMSHYRDWYSMQHEIKAQNAPSLDVDTMTEAVEHWMGNCPF